jgi:tRNA dimethylallyltransferase
MSVDSQHDAPVALFTLIAGPTASGKSKLALEMARERGAIVVNADSMQVYRDLKILTARPGEADCAAVPHRLYGFRDGSEPYSVAAWLEDLAPLVAEARAGGPPLVIAGGTGLYFRALLEGLSPVPEIAEEIRSHWRAEAERRGGPVLHNILKDRDPDMAARLQPTDPQRIARALEVLDATGRSLLGWQADAGEPLIHAEEAERIWLSPPRDELYARCDARWDQMMDDGAVEEVERLRARGLDRSLPVMRAVGVRPLAAYLGGAPDLEAACRDARTETRRYAKRQLTWARKYMISWNANYQS